MFSITIVGHGGSYNRGCEAIIRGTVGIIRRHINPCKISIISFSPSSDRAALGQDLLDGTIALSTYETPYFPRFSARWFAEKLVDKACRLIMPNFPTWPMHHGRYLVRGSDVVVGVGGDNFSDDFGVRPAPFFGDLALARRMGCKTVIWAASIGRFRNKALEPRWAEELRKVDLITVRESDTFNYLKDLGVVHNVHRVGDPGYLLPITRVEGIDLRSEGIRKIVGIGMSGLAGQKYKAGSDYLSAFSSLGRNLLAEGSTKLVIISHVTGNHPDLNDLIYCRKLADQLGAPERVIVPGVENNASQMKYFISQCDYFIGARTHSTIAAFSTYVPTISVGSTLKVYGLNRDLFGHTEFVLPVEEVSFESLRRKMDFIMKRREESVSALRSRIPSMKALAEEGGKYLAELLKDPEASR